MSVPSLNEDQWISLSFFQVNSSSHECVKTKEDR